MLWLLFGALALLVVATLAYPLLPATGAALPRRVDFDVVVYRDQLKELEEEIDRGILTKDQAAAARTEIHRRMLAAEEADSQPGSTKARKGGRAAMIAAIALIAIGVPAGAAVMYGALGSPKLAYEPSRDQSATSADALEAQLKASPSAEGYKRLANMYFAESRFDKAVAADHRAIDLGATDSTTWSEFGESIVMAGDGQVPTPALVAFTNAISMDPTDARARFYIGLAEAQIGNLRQAVAIWRDLQNGADPNAKWYAMVQQHIDAFSKEGGFDPASISPSAPSAEDLRSSIAAMTAAMDQDTTPPGTKKALRLSGKR